MATTQQELTSSITDILLDPNKSPELHKLLDLPKQDALPKIEQAIKKAISLNSDRVADVEVELLPDGSQSQISLKLRYKSTVTTIRFSPYLDGKNRLDGRNLLSGKLS